MIKICNHFAFLGRGMLSKSLSMFRKSDERDLSTITLFIRELSRDLIGVGCPSFFFNFW
jgi:hypothetical protein